jgi:apolipoprotein D and lipocalin family protein
MIGCRARRSSEPLRVDPTGGVRVSLLISHFIKLFTGCLVVLVALAGCAEDDEPALVLAAKVDLQRYAGRWYIIANIPYFAERGKVGSFFDISFPEGTVLDVYYGHSQTFDAPAKSFTMRGYVVRDTGNARWRESPLWPIYLSYLILWVDPDYRYALVGYPGRGYGWVLSRSPTVDNATYRELLGRFAAQRYNLLLFRRVPQAPEQIGQPGYR